VGKLRFASGAPSNFFERALRLSGASMVRRAVSSTKSLGLVHDPKGRQLDQEPRAGLTSAATRARVSNSSEDLSKKKREDQSQLPRPRRAANSSEWPSTDAHAARSQRFRFVLRRGAAFIPRSMRRRRASERDGLSGCWAVQASKAVTVSAGRRNVRCGSRPVAGRPLFGVTDFVDMGIFSV
jgi:hypothetical protein